MGGTEFDFTFFFVSLLLTLKNSTINNIYIKIIRKIF
jgi:hypothetical protein